ncbi:MAG: hypothetical protein EOS58_09905 [Mesorhizobium sp.]|uniref:hypothetical protein n=1 Tax=unclassified Mesorhizobium TaxID=325217 RepID=UPI000F75D0EA|nr:MULTISPECIES: hypothetical protein [unclassified Mesorhizobium]RVD71495.1 hypothetical protein EN751_15105 [Mesorhizobium sp. M4A.F.Ca.ET.029.04.2.1]AZO50769.1 hypothetical protein EJ073_25875 [Mesorhizobium sp. M4B.F.Ca.ET.058.02.1.1]RUX49155.1 hypothetical protein EOA33_13370 [Mesorhizobium sp. M4A.F.Ca.ET.050.02.1.1]RVD37594.1 hypothetical protein EN742_19760 [Mesorhizobium sp. M4A.F.Ca.ET.020.02.1.1]RWC22739.1 MAG: hypothetical protein EOS53_00355 [Mesorhizobium sp.]
MAKDRTARPVSGEIMAGLGTSAALQPRGPVIDIVDADYEVLPRLSAMPEAPAASPSRATATPTIEGMDMLRKPEAATERQPASRGGPLFWIAGVSAALAAFWVSGGHALVRQSPFWKAAQPAAVFSISDITSRIDASGLKPVLFVDGEAANDGAQAAQMPPLEIRVTGNDSQVTRYTLGTSGRSLAPGERFGFSSRLDVPRNGVKAVAVNFAG